MTASHLAPHGYHASPYAYDDRVRQARVGEDPGSSTSTSRRRSPRIILSPPPPPGDPQYVPGDSHWSAPRFEPRPQYFSGDPQSRWPAPRVAPSLEYARMLGSHAVQELPPEGLVSTYLMDAAGRSHANTWGSVEGAWLYYDTFREVSGKPVYFAIFDRRMMTWPAPLSEVSDLRSQAAPTHTGSSWTPPQVGTGSTGIPAWHRADPDAQPYLAGVLERSVIFDAITALGRRAQLWAWRWLAELGTPNAWLYTTSADISREQIQAVEPERARQRLHLMGSGRVGFWAILELGASAPRVVDAGVEDASVAYLAGSPLVADTRARERGR